MEENEGDSSVAQNGRDGFAASAYAALSAKFTPGTWVAIPEAGTHRLSDQGAWGVSAKSGAFITWAIGYGAPRKQETRFNAFLIAAGPELVEALFMMVEEKADYMRRNNLGDPEEQHTIKVARAALAKATEDQPRPERIEATT